MIDGQTQFVIPSRRFFVDARVAGSKICRFRGTIDGISTSVLIPCFEIFRFYYKHSTKLAYRILRGDFAAAPYTVFNAAGSFVSPEGCGRIELAPTMDRGDAYTIARFVLSPVGLRRAKVITQRTMGGKFESLPIDVLPPFDGRWTLKVRGKWISYGKERAFLVFAMMRCGASIPFERLEVFGGNASLAGATSNGAAVGDSREPIERRHAITPGPDLTLQTGEAGLESLPQRLPTLDSDARLPQVPVEYKARRRTIAAKGSKLVITHQEKNDGTALVTDQRADSGQSLASFDSERHRTRVSVVESIDMFDLFQRALDLLPTIARQQSMSCEVTTETIDLADAFSVAAPLIVFVSRDTDVSRRVLLAHLQLGEGKGLLMEVQRRPRLREESRTLIVVDENLTRVKRESIFSILELWVNRGGHLRDISGLPTLKALLLSGVNHSQRDTAESYATRMLEGIIRLIRHVKPDAQLEDFEQDRD
jgi:hypothetical protein